MNFIMFYSSILIFISVVPSKEASMKITKINFTPRDEVIEVDGKNYTFGMKNVNWYEADFSCKSVGQQLITLDSKEKSNFWQRWLQLRPDYDMWTWTSGRREAGAEDFIWTTTGIPFDPEESAWAPLEPNTENVFPQCVNFMGYPEGWEDDDCSDFKLSYICEDTIQKL